MIGGWIALFISANAIRRTYSRELMPPQPGPQHSRAALASHRHVVRNNIYCCMLLRFLWFLMQQKLTHTESSEQFSLARAKGTDLK